MKPEATMGRNTFQLIESVYLVNEKIIERLSGVQGLGELVLAILRLPPDEKLLALAQLILVATIARFLVRQILRQFRRFSGLKL
jgi:hypothetical protein